ncbi:MAG: pentapeptide repeat-containing protein [Treponema sp.]|nr:pentapeptide repeat-containing protein [Treponema sp.]
MFLQNKCLVSSCNKVSLSSFDENGNILELRNYCLDHIPNPGKAKEDIFNFIKNNDTIVGLNASGILFSDLDFSNKRFYGCNFTNCTFTNIHSSNFRSRMSIFDFAIFNDCNIVESKIQFSSFSGCTLNHTLFTSSEIIQSNYNGVKCFQSSFDDSDLFNSKFIKSTLVNTSFRNCNLKNTDFFTSERSNVSFKMSNTREARFSRDGSELYTGIESTDSVSDTKPSEPAMGGEK